MLHIHLAEVSKVVLPNQIACRLLHSGNVERPAAVAYTGVQCRAEGCVLAGHAAVGCLQHAKQGEGVPKQHAELALVLVRGQQLVSQVSLPL